MSASAATWPQTIGLRPVKDACQGTVITPLGHNFGRVSIDTPILGGWGKIYGYLANALPLTQYDAWIIFRGPSSPQYCAGEYKVGSITTDLTGAVTFGFLQFPKPPIPPGTEASFVEFRPALPVPLPGGLLNLVSF